MLIAGALLVAANPSGYDGLAAAVIGGYVVAILNAWVLLAEMLRWLSRRDPPGNRTPGNPCTTSSTWSGTADHGRQDVLS